ncbi:hypothetical protein CONLIGDRAFT_319458 [Coniochaeta ligniaria NRRL 30616]|uniref:Uncharacterized protein n=1 Tax=Coniochaeta ligniaria NRRL 30616 TaxID=1408157 RepID=A0A1J7I3W9_9PEZI|nr:hypothetical protein CONLIGDRAFT_319458 [Coniochaeta ligniaria NRRL 30616]
MVSIGADADPLAVMDSSCRVMGMEGLCISSKPLPCYRSWAHSSWSLEDGLFGEGYCHAELGAGRRIRTEVKGDTWLGQATQRATADPRETTTNLRGHAWSRGIGVSAGDLGAG